MGMQTNEGMRFKDFCKKRNYVTACSMYVSDILFYLIIFSFYFLVAYEIQDIQFVKKLISFFENILK